MLARGGIIGAAGAVSSPRLLVGDSTTPSAFTQIAGNEFYYVRYEQTAVASGVPAKIYVYLGSNVVGNKIVAAIYNSSNVKIAESGETNIVANSWISCTIVGSPGALSSGSAYRVGFVANGAVNMGRRTTTWRSCLAASTYPATPSTISPTTQAAAAPEPAIYVFS